MNLNMWLQVFLQKGRNDSDVSTADGQGVEDAFSLDELQNFRVSDTNPDGTLKRVKTAVRLGLNVCGFISYADSSGYMLPVEERSHRKDRTGFEGYLPFELADQHGDLRSSCDIRRLILLARCSASTGFGRFVNRFFHHLYYPNGKEGRAVRDLIGRAPWFEAADPGPKGFVLASFSDPHADAVYRERWQRLLLCLADIYFNASASGLLETTPVGLRDPILQACVSIRESGGWLGTTEFSDSRVAPILTCLTPIQFANRSQRDVNARGSCYAYWDVTAFCIKRYSVRVLGSSGSLTNSLKNWSDCIPSTTRYSIFDDALRTAQHYLSLRDGPRSYLIANIMNDGSENLQNAVGAFNYYPGQIQQASGMLKPNDVLTASGEIIARNLRRFTVPSGGSTLIDIDERDLRSLPVTHTLFGLLVAGNLGSYGGLDISKTPFMSEHGLCGHFDQYIQTLGGAPVASLLKSASSVRSRYRNHAYSVIRILDMIFGPGSDRRLTISKQGWVFDQAGSTWLNWLSSNRYPLSDKTVSALLTLRKALGGSTESAHGVTTHIQADVVNSHHFIEKDGDKYYSNFLQLGLFSLMPSYYVSLPADHPVKLPSEATDVKDPIFLVDSLSIGSGTIRSLLTGTAPDHPLIDLYEGLASRRMAKSFLESLPSLGARLTSKSVAKLNPVEAPKLDSLAQVTLLALHESDLAWPTE